MKIENRESGRLGRLTRRVLMWAGLVAAVPLIALFGLVPVAAAAPAPGGGVVCQPGAPGWPGCQGGQPVLTIAGVTGPKKIKSGRKMTVRVTVKNTGTAAATNLRVCLSGPPRLITGSCAKLTKADAGKTVVLNLPARTQAVPKNTPTTYRIKMTDLKGKPHQAVGHVTLLR